MLMNYTTDLKIDVIKLFFNQNINMYSQLFNQTQLNNYKLAQILNVSITQVIQYRKSKNVNYERLFEFMRKLEIKEFNFDDGKIKIKVKL
jgi:hypothetical protein